MASEIVSRVGGKIKDRTKESTGMKIHVSFLWHCCAQKCIIGNHFLVLPHNIIPLHLLTISIKKTCENTMEASFIFIPLLGQILLVIILYAALGRAKSKTAKQGLVDETRRALYPDAWPENVQKINNSIKNQYEIPVLFYALTFILWATQSVNIFVFALACGFVTFRYMHAYIHTHSNFVPKRRPIWMIGFVIMIILFITTCVAVITNLL